MTPLAKRLNTPWLPAALIAILMLVVLLSQLYVHDWDPSYFISIGDKYIMRRDAVPPNVHVLPNSTGYDGQFYYQLALNPFSPQQINAGLNISNGPYRHQRIIYPLFVWLFSLGNFSLVPTMLVFVNYLALCAIAWLGGRYAQIYDRHALWGCLFALFSGFLFTVSRDLTEILVAMFLLASIIALHLSRSVFPPALLLTLAVLTRETALLAVIALGLASIGSRHCARWPIFGIPVGIYAVWQVALFAKWGQLPLLAGRHNIGAPGNGILVFLSLLDVNNSMHWVWINELAHVIIVAAIALFVLLRASHTLLPEKLSWILYGLMAISLTQHVWVEDNAFMRAMTEFYLFGLVLIVPHVHNRLLISISASMAMTWMLVYSMRLSW